MRVAIWLGRRKQDVRNLDEALLMFIVVRARPIPTLEAQNLFDTKKRHA